MGPTSYPPVAAPGAIPVGGDLTGTAAAAVVAKIGGVAVGTAATHAATDFDAAGAAAAAQAASVQKVAPQSVASAGGGAQSTVIGTFTPTSDGLYLVMITASATTADSAVTLATTHTDAVNNTLQTTTVANNVNLGANSFTRGVNIVWAKAGAAISALFTSSNQATTIGNAAFIRVTTP